MAPKPLEETPDEAAKKRPKTGETATWLRYSHLGIQYCVTLLLFVLLGTWADGKLATDPWLTIAGSLAGMTVATYLLIRSVQPRSR